MTMNFMRVAPKSGKIFAQVTCGQRKINRQIKRERRCAPTQLFGAAIELVCSVSRFIRRAPRTFSFVGGGGGTACCAKSQEPPRCNLLMIKMPLLVGAAAVALILAAANDDEHANGQLAQLASSSSSRLAEFEMLATCLLGQMSDVPNELPRCVCVCVCVRVV